MVAVASFQVIPFPDTDLHLTSPQVSIPKPFFSLKFKAFRKPVSEPSALYRSRRSLVSRAQFLTQKSEPQGKPTPSQEPRAQKSRKDLQSLRDALQTQSRGEDLRSYNDNPKQASQKLRGSSARQADVQPNNVVVSEQRRRHLSLDPPAHLQRGPESMRTGDLVFSHAEKNIPIASDLNRGKTTQAPRRRGSRNSSRGFDVLDDLMSSQGRSSKALLESLQSAVAFEKDEMLNFGRDSTEGAGTSSFLSRNVPTSEYIGRKQDTVSQMFLGVQRWQRDYEDATDPAVTSSPFASSLEKALSPSVGAKSNIAANASVVQQSIPSSDLEDASDVSQPSLRGQEVLWALQKAAVEKAKQKKKSRKPNDRALKGKDTASLHDSGEWRNAKPIVLKPEWALQIDDIERRIESLKSPVPLS